MPLLSFKNLFLTVGDGDTQKDIIQGVSHTIERGQVVAILGPSGSGKTTLLNILALRGPHFGKAYGTITFDDKVYNGKEFKKHAYYVQQYDKNWDNLTVSQTMMYAARMFGCKDNEITSEVDEMLVSMGLGSAEDTRCKSLSGGQQRRLSLAIALLKKPYIMFLDEITSGLDSVSSFKVCELLCKAAHEKNIAVVCTIHQPSTKVFKNFNQIMILSKGRLAYAGKRTEAESHFTSLGFPIPPLTSEPEHYLDIVDADFGSPEEVQKILNGWTLKASLEVNNNEGNTVKNTVIDSGIYDNSARTAMQLGPLFSRQIQLIIRDPIVYVGRAAAFLIVNTLFAFIYWKTRKMVQVQALNKAQLIIWFFSATSICGVVAVMYLNSEYKVVLREAQNGMYNISGYIMAGLLLSIPTIIIFGLSAIPIPIFLISGFDASNFSWAIGTWSLHILVFESLAECLAVWIDDPTIGMLVYMSYWVLGFLMSGIFLPEKDMFWPIKILHYQSSYGYYARSMVNLLMRGETFDSCNATVNILSPVCIESTSGIDVMLELQKVITVFGDMNYLRDTLITVSIIIGFKFMFIFGLIQKADKFYSPKPSPEISIAVKQAYAPTIAEGMRIERTKDVDNNILLSLFTAIDTDRNGVIDESEFFAFTKDSKYCNFNRKTCNTLFRTIDTTENGTLSFSEFCIFFKSLLSAVDGTDDSKKNNNMDTSKKRKEQRNTTIYQQYYGKKEPYTTRINSNNPNQIVYPSLSPVDMTEKYMTEQMNYWDGDIEC